VVFSAALALPEQSRAQLADVLWASLPEEQLDLFVTDEVRQCRSDSPPWEDDLRRGFRKGPANFPLHQDSMMVNENLSESSPV
jgi:hypothetical protein